MKNRYSFLFVVAVSFAVAVLFRSTAQSVPSFARQTGLACNGCHTTPPELNSAGRRFKLLGYTDRAQETPAVVNEPKENHAGLNLLKTLPLSAWLETSYTLTNKTQPGTQNGNVEFPQDISLFLSGGWTTHIGSFVQVTYTKQDDHFSIDNSDVRYANLTKMGGKELVYGLTLNNNPTVEDLWNTTPAWGYPFMASDSAPTPTAAPIIASLGQDVAGLGAYAMWDDHLYLAGTLYRSDHVGSPAPTSGEGFAVNIRGVAPYWRVAWQQTIAGNNFLEVGGFGMRVKSTPNSVSGPEDEFTDWGADAQYDQTLFRTDVLSLRGTYIRENSTLTGSFDQGGADREKHHLSSVAASANYHLGNRYSAGIGWFHVTGTPDALLFAPADLTGSATGSPNSSGYIANVSWWPVQNCQLAAQYTGYTKFNGAKTNYDGSGRNASDNNTLYVLARFVF